MGTLSRYLDEKAPNRFPVVEFSMKVSMHAARRAYERIGVKISAAESEDLVAQLEGQTPLGFRPDGKPEFRVDLEGGIPVRVVWDPVAELICTLWLDRWELIRRARK